MAKTKEAPRVLDAEDRKYELIFILQPNLLASGVEKKLREFDAFLEQNGASIELKDVWGKKQLAYRIGKNDEGIYVVYNMTLPTTFNSELDEHMRIDKDVIRFLLVKTPENYQYQRYEEAAAPAKKESGEDKRRPGATSHKSAGAVKTEVKDKGKKADADSLDDKLGAILGGEDIKV